jgi:class 3 adenylate cyclase
LHPERLQELERAELTDDGVQQMLDLAERLRAANGGELDESAILAVSEATGAPVEYVRLANRLRPEEKKRGFIHRLRSEYLGLDPEVRRNVLGGSLGVMFALASVLSVIPRNSFVGLLGVVQILCVTLGIYLVSVAKDARSAAITGAIATTLGFIAATIFQPLFGVSGVEPTMMIPITLLGAIGSMVANMIVSKNRRKLGLKDPVKERQELLRQLEDLKAKLNSGEQPVTFLSVDIVGSTKMKELAEPLSIEYTFNEYHQFVDRIVRKYGGSVHSTAGDGMTCAFDTPTQAFGAAKNIQAGLIELNTFGNKTGFPIALRAGIHTGNVVAPRPGDIASLNFAHVIDIAAHLQKVAPIGGIVVSEAAAKSLPGGSATVGTELVEVQNVTGLVWQPRLLPTPTSAVSPPPLQS